MIKCNGIRCNRKDQCETYGKENTHMYPLWYYEKKDKKCNYFKEKKKILKTS